MLSNNMRQATLAASITVWSMDRLSVRSSSSLTELVGVIRGRFNEIAADFTNFCGLGMAGETKDVAETNRRAVDIHDRTGDAGIGPVGNDRVKFQFDTQRR